MPEPDLTAPDEVRGYRVDELLGRGGMGVVYLAEDLRLRRKVALKLLAPDLAQDAVFRGRFLAESELTASLDHPCVIPIYEAGEADGRLFISMRYVRGLDLRALLRRGPLSPRRAIEICGQIADALDFAHARGLVHRDVKPSNVLLDERDHVYLADFGLTRRMEDAYEAEPGLLGTIDYVAPEQIRGDPVDGRADQYALACLLCECLTGEPPFSRATSAAVLFSHLEEQPAGPPGLEGVIPRALAKEPGDRYATCTEMVLAAGQALGLTEAIGGPGLVSLRSGRVCPYKGLAAFQRADAEYFAGRERTVAEVVGRLASSAVVGILGPSGIGKSSLLRAGVLSALSAGALPGSERWRQVLVRPGADPVSEFVRALGHASFEATLAELEADERLILAVDQLEEIFTEGESEPDRATFLELLSGAARDRDQRVVVVAALRADFYGRLVAYPAFAQLISASHVLVGPMDRNELARAIEEPAVRAGLEIEPPLLDALVSDVAGEPGALPLLSTMLLELWQAREGRTLTVESYRASGGVRGAVARLAERTFGELDQRERGVLRQVMLRLASGEDEALVRRRASLSELAEIDGAERVLDVLTEARLITVSDDHVEVSHEALLREWPRYRAWLEDSAVSRRLHEHLIASAPQWEAGGRSTDELYRGPRLAAALEWASEHGDLMNELERDFLTASTGEAERVARRQRAQNRRLRGVAIAFAVLASLALVAVIFAEIQRGKADQQRRIAQSLQLATSAQAMLGTDPQTSAVLALRALRISRTSEAEQALRLALPQLRLIGTVRARGAFSSAVFSPDGAEILTASAADRTARLWSVRTRRQLRVFRANADLHNAAFSPDGKMIVTSGTYGPARIWNAVNGERLGQLTGSWGRYHAAFSPDGTKIITASRGGSTTQLWSAVSHRRLRTITEPGAGLPSGNAVYDAAYSPDGTKIVTASADGVARVWDAALRRALGVLREPGNSPMLTAVFSPDGTKVLTASSDGIARLWSARSFQPLAEFVEPGGGQLNSASFSPDGTEIATASADGTVRVWSARSRQQLFLLAGHAGSVQTAAFSPDGSMIVTAGRDGTARLWTATPIGQTGTLSPSNGRKLNSAVFSSDGAKILTAGSDATARIWSAASNRQLAVLRDPVLGPAYYGRGVVQAAFSLNGTAVVTASQDGSARIWTAGRDTRLGGDQPPLTGAAFSPDGREVVISGEDGTAQIWDAQTGHRLAVFRDPGGKSFFDEAAFDRSGTEIVTAGADGTARIWSVRTGHQLEAVAEPNRGRLTSAAFSATGEEIVTASADGIARIWSLRTRRQVESFAEPGGSPVNSAAFSPGGTEIVTASADGTARIWSAADGRQLTVLIGNGPMNDAAFSPNGSEIVTADDYGIARVWSAQLAGPLATIERIAESRPTG